MTKIDPLTRGAQVPRQRDTFRLRDSRDEHPILCRRLPHHSGHAPPHGRRLARTRGVPPVRLCGAPLVLHHLADVPRTGDALAPRLHAHGPCQGRARRDAAHQLHRRRHVRRGGPVRRPRAHAPSRHRHRGLLRLHPQGLQRALPRHHVARTLERHRRGRRRGGPARHAARRLHERAGRARLRHAPGRQGYRPFEPRGLACHRRGRLRRRAPARALRRRPRGLHLHLGHHGPPQGRDDHAPQHRLQRPADQQVLRL